MSKEHNGSDQDSVRDESRRDFLKSGGAIAGGLAAAGAAGYGASAAASVNVKGGVHSAPAQNPYGARPGGGISLPDYYRPWPAIKTETCTSPAPRSCPRTR